MHAYNRRVLRSVKDNVYPLFPLGLIQVGCGGRFVRKLCFDSQRCMTDPRPFSVSSHIAKRALRSPARMLVPQINLFSSIKSVESSSDVVVGET